MGYRSQVKIVVSKEGFRELKDYVEKESVKFIKPESDYDYNLLKHTDQIRFDGDQVVISWDDIKWYENCYDDVDTIMHGLEHLDSEGYSYRFYRVGEDCDDIEETCIDGELDQDLEYLYICRYIDDDAIGGNVISYDDLDNCNPKGGE